MLNLGFGVLGMEVPKYRMSPDSPQNVARVRGTSVVSIRLIEVDCEDSYCHQGVNRSKEKGVICANTVSEIKDCVQAEAELDQ